ncbi:MAG: 23S rRNA (pseudouridine(1915)-N(3))-methyltransferase RlmH [Gammaproteobacteria bacterium]|nr:23S rRNA (pseudouridine(1915)-N(3))-methyltransferase RlmH [Gammaproteobacteria bacterium]
MLIRLLAIGNKMPAWIEAGVAEYLKRFPPSCRLELIEIPAEKRLQDSPKKKLIDNESKKLLSAIKPGNHIIALEVKGALWSTEKLADQLKAWQANGRNIDMLIGGPDGLSNECLQKAETKWSLSPLTLPHPLVRVLVAEQLYRAISILQNHPYHR